MYGKRFDKILCSICRKFVITIIVPLVVNQIIRKKQQKLLKQTNFICNICSENLFTFQNWSTKFAYHSLVEIFVTFCAKCSFFNNFGFLREKCKVISCVFFRFSSIFSKRNTLSKSFKHMLSIFSITKVQGAAYSPLPLQKRERIYKHVWGVGRMGKMLSFQKYCKT